MLSFLHGQHPSQERSRKTAQPASSFRREQDCTLGEIILEAIEREVARREWHKRFSGRPMTQLSSSAAELLEQERRQRDRNLP
jgi:hypothetical protein